MTDSKTGRPEPNGCTMGDLMALTLGVAIATSLVWFNTPAVAGLVGRRPAPGWYSAANQGFELLQKGCVAMVPVILARRIRFGGPLRPVEYLPMLMATMLVAYSISRWPVFGLYYRRSGSTDLSVNPEVYYVWKLSEVAVGALAALVVLLHRRRPPDWIRAVSLAVAWQMLATWICYFYQEWANARLMELRVPLYLALGSSFLVSAPQMVIHYLPMMIAIIDLARPLRGRRTWIVAAAAAVAFSMQALGEARNLARMALDPGNPLFDSFWIAGKILALTASFALARWTEPAWRRFLEGSEVIEDLGTRSY